MVKAFKGPRMKQKDILSRESVDEIIYRSKKIRDRLILELQARCGMRIGEILNLRASDITDRKLIIRQPKSGKDIEVAFMTESIAKRLSESKFDPMICVDIRPPMPAVTASLWKWYQRSSSGTRILRQRRCTWGK
jgi:integrase